MIKLIKNDLKKILYFRTLHVFAIIIFLGISVNILLYPQANEYADLFVTNGVFISLVSDIFPVFVIIICTFLVANEIERGTVKLYLFQGYSRFTVITSKFAACVAFLIALFFIILALSYITALLVKNANVFNATVLYHNIKMCVLAIIPLTLLSFMSVCLSFFVKKSIVCIIILFAIYYFADKGLSMTEYEYRIIPTVDNIMQNFNLAFYFPFASLKIILDETINQSMINQSTIEYERYTTYWLISSGVYSILLYFISLYRFTKKSFFK